MLGNFPSPTQRERRKVPFILLHTNKCGSLVFFFFFRNILSRGKITMM